MNWWLKSRAVLTLAGCTVLMTLAGLAFGSTELPLPALTGGSGRFLLAGLTPVLPAVLWLNSTGRVGPHTESTAVRAVARWDTALATGLATAVLALTLVGHLLGADVIALTVGRNTIVFIGIALVLEPLAGHRSAAVLTSVVPLFCAAAGWRSGGVGAEPWALILHPGNSVPAFAASLTLLAAGAVFSFVRPFGTRASWLREATA
ncbi:hypothetical protein [Streptomyces bambusae]|uniref:ABC transporter n=1 Tax=Streptomyces bambusae TaxID=1550616 RepID=A0ABS6Z3X1_9ACTN|nr:hypothetical protein [Streptomyces bambusae]MBW5482449.1 hypothetical protein [Streptomyces bambusae]